MALYGRPASARAAAQGGGNIRIASMLVTVSAARLSHALASPVCPSSVRLSLEKSARGLPLSDDEKQEAADYLAAFFSPMLHEEGSDRAA